LSKEFAMGCEHGCDHHDHDHHHHAPQTGFGTWRPTPQDPLLGKKRYEEIQKILDQIPEIIGDQTGPLAESLNTVVPITRSLLEQLATILVTLEDYAQRGEDLTKENRELKASLVDMRLKAAAKLRR